MKKYILLLCIGAFAFTACDQNELDIAQKGVLTTETFYKTDADAQAALVGVYFDSHKNFAKSDPEYNFGPIFGLTNFQADDMWLSGSGTGDCVSQREYQQFRYTYDNALPRDAYTAFYRSIHKTNLVITNFTEAKLGSALTPVMKRCIAEARVMRAYDHMMLGIYWGTPPIVEEVLTGASRPKNAESQDAVMTWVAKEIDLALPDLTERQGKTDKPGAVKITKGFAYAVKGKALMWKKDYNGAKIALKAVITSGNYGLVPSNEMVKIGHADGKASSEAVFEFNITADPAVVTSTSTRTGWNDHMTFNWRFENLVGDGPVKDAQVNANGWGWLNPTGKFAEDLIANDGINSARRKAWIKTYDEVLYDHQWTSDVTPFVPGRTAFKETDLQRGVKSTASIYGNEGYFCWKIVVHKDQGDINKVNSGWDRNLSLMRYNEVLLLYAEACAQTSDADGLTYLKEIQNRAQSNHVSSTLTLAEVQKEKQFELWLEGSRSADLIRWGLTASLETQGNYVPELRDELNKGVGPVHKALIDKSTANYYTTTYGTNIGFKKGKHELLPFPKQVIDLNTALKQNPGWE